MTTDNQPLHPMQPLVRDKYGEVRFRKNAIIEHLVITGKIDLNHICTLNFNDEDRVQLAQLIGYSVDGFSDLSYVPPEVKMEAYKAAAALNLTESAERQANEPEPPEKPWSVRVSAYVTDMIVQDIVVWARTKEQAMEVAKYRIENVDGEFGDETIDWKHTMCGDLEQVSADDAVEITEEEAAAKGTPKPETAPG